MKIRTDFVTNSSSSSFVAVVGITLINGEHVEWRSVPYCDEDNGSLDVSLNVASLCSAKSIDELISMLRTGIMVDDETPAISMQSRLIKRISKLESMDYIESVTVGGREFFYYNGFWFRYYICNRATGEIKAAFDGEDLNSVDGGRSDMYEEYTAEEVTDLKDIVDIMSGNFRFKNESENNKISGNDGGDSRKGRIYVAVKDVASWDKIAELTMPENTGREGEKLLESVTGTELVITDILHLDSYQMMLFARQIINRIGEKECCILADWTKSVGLPEYKVFYSFGGKLDEKIVYEKMSEVKLPDVSGWLRLAGVRITDKRLAFMSGFPSDNISSIVRKEEYVAEIVSRIEKYSFMFEDAVKSRGKKLYKDGCVKKLEKTNYGYIAKVQGSELYSVVADTEGKKTPQLTCSCPYQERGKKCKHIYAVMLAIEDQSKERDN